jgi:hypothetical protein
MRTLRFAITAIVGFLLYQYVVVYLGGIFAAVPIPSSYFAFFGRDNVGFSHALLNLGLHTLPTTLLIAGGVLATHSFLPTSKPMTWVPFLLGMLSALFLWVLVLTPAQMQSIGVQSEGALEELRRMLVFPWWAASNFLAPWLGVAFAAWLISRNQHQTERGGV